MNTAPKSPFACVKDTLRFTVERLMTCGRALDALEAEVKRQRESGVLSLGTRAKRDEARSEFRGAANEVALAYSSFDLADMANEMEEFIEARERREGAEVDRQIDEAKADDF